MVLAQMTRAESPEVHMPIAPAKTTKLDKPPTPRTNSEAATHFGPVPIFLESSQAAANDEGLAPMLRSMMKNY